MRGLDTVKVYDVAVGADKHPTPSGTFLVHKIVWNPAWVPPKEKWAKGKGPQERTMSLQRPTALTIVP